MNEFKTYHPIVNFSYFMIVIIFSMFLMHPVCLGVSFVSAFIYSVMLKGKKAIKTNLLYMLPLMIFTAVINPLVNHAGVTILCYLPSGNPLTLESVFYGLSASVMIVSVIAWFSCYNEVMTSDKFIYLFGRVIPSLSLVLSMTLRFVPRFSTHLRKVTAAQKCLGRDISQGSVIKRAKNALAILSIMVTWSLENAIETADSMKSRGYGLGRRTAFSNYIFDKRDVEALFVIIVLGIYITVGAVLGKLKFWYFPMLGGADATVYSISIFCAYSMLCICPIVIEWWEVRRWEAMKSKI